MDSARELAQLVDRPLEFRRSLGEGGSRRRVGAAAFAEPRQ
jgi:hypothetical protein